MGLATSLKDLLYQNWDEAGTGIAKNDIFWTDSRIGEVEWLREKGGAGKAYLIAVYEAGGSTVTPIALQPLTVRVEEPLVIDVNIKFSKGTLQDMLSKRDAIRREVHRIILEKSKSLEGALWIHVSREPTVSESENILRLQILVTAFRLETGSA